MAINFGDKRSLFEAIIPAVSFSITSNSITVSSERLSTPRIVPFDIPGKCRHCKSTEAEIDYMVTREGVTVWCSRINGPAFVPFDFVYDLPGHTFFKIKNKGRAFDVEHVQPQPAPNFCAEQPKPITVQKGKVDQQQQQQLYSKEEAIQGWQLDDLIGTLTDASTFLPSQQQHAQTNAFSPNVQPSGTGEVNASANPHQQMQGLVDTLSAAAAFLPSQQQQQQQQQQQVPPQVDVSSSVENGQNAKKKKLEKKKKPSIEMEKVGEEVSDGHVQNGNLSV